MIPYIIWSRNCIFFQDLLLQLFTWEAWELRARFLTFSPSVLSVGLTILLLCWPQEICWATVDLLPTTDICLSSSPLTNGKALSASFIYIYIYLAVLGLSCGIQTLSCGMWDLVPWPRSELGTPALKVQSLSHYTSREVDLPPGRSLYFLRPSSHKVFKGISCKRALGSWWPS